MLSLLETSMLRSKKETMVSFLHLHPEYVDEALALCISDKQPFCWRAAWMLQEYFEPNPTDLWDYIPDIIKAIPHKKDGHQRELLKLLKLVYLNDDQEGELYECCLKIWMQIHKNPSVRYIALEYLLNTAQKYPELLHELELVLTEEYIDTLSPGIKHGVKKRLSKLKKNK